MMSGMTGRATLACQATALFLAAVLGCGSDGNPTTGAGGAGGNGEAGSGGATGGAGGQAGGGGSLPRSCWEDDVTSWDAVEPFDMSTLGENARDPMLSPDGLSLYYAARTNATAPTRVFHTTRSDLASDFTAGDQTASWTGFQPIGHPWVSGTQLALTLDDGNGNFQLAMSIHDGQTWSFPAELGPLVNDPGAFANSNATLTADAKRMIFARNAGGLDHELYEAARPDGVPLEPFGNLAPVAIPGLETDDAVICPALSPDGLHLFFSTTFPTDITGGIPDGALTVWHTERPDRDSPWAIPTHIGAFDDPVDLTCMHAIRGDGCEIWIERFQLGQSETSFFIGRR